MLGVAPSLLALVSIVGAALLPAVAGAAFLMLAEAVFFAAYQDCLCRSVWRRLRGGVPPAVRAGPGAIGTTIGEPDAGVTTLFLHEREKNFPTGGPWQWVRGDRSKQFWKPGRHSAHRTPVSLRAFNPDGKNYTSARLFLLHFPQNITAYVRGSIRNNAIFASSGGELTRPKKVLQFSAAMAGEVAAFGHTLETVGQSAMELQLADRYRVANA